MHRFVDPADGQCYLYTQYEPADARRVFANFEQPDLKAEFTFHVMAPSDWQVASNGAEALRTPAHQRPGHEPLGLRPHQGDVHLHHHRAGRAVLQGRGRLARDARRRHRLEVPLALYCRASMAPSFDAEALFALTKNGLDFFNELFDFPYPWGKYDQAFVPEYNLGAMENPGWSPSPKATSSPRGPPIRSTRPAPTPSCTRWRTCGSATSSPCSGGTTCGSRSPSRTTWAPSAWTATTDWDTAWVNFANNRKAWAYVQDQLPTTHPIVADIPDLEAAKQNFDGITYAKGASVLKQLVAYVGFDAFIAGSRRYFRDHAYGNTTLADLLAALSAASGRDLGGVGPPVAADLRASPPCTSGIDGARRRRSAPSTLLQDAVDPTTGRQEPRPHRLRIGLYDLDDAGALVRTDSVETDVSGARTEVTGPGRASRGRPCCWSTTRTSATPRSGWTRAPRPRSAAPWTR